MLNWIGFWEVTSSEASSSEAEHCAEDIEVEQIITKTNENKISEAQTEQVNSLQASNPDKIIDRRMAFEGICGQ